MKQENPTMNDRLAKELLEIHRTREILMLKVLPCSFAICGALYWLLYRGAPLSHFVLLLALPIVFAFVVVGPAGRLKLWTWSHPVHIRVLVWVGFTQCLFFLNGRLITDSAVSFIEAGVSGALSCAVLGTLYDILAIDSRIITVFNRAHYKGLGPIQSACSYGFAFFGGFGLISCLIAKIAFQRLDHEVPFPDAMITILSGSLALCVPFWIFLLSASRKKLRAEKRRKELLAHS